jgi:hypothetical protein
MSPFMKTFLQKHRAATYPPMAIDIPPEIIEVEPTPAAISISVTVVAGDSGNLRQASIILLLKPFLQSLFERPSHYKNDGDRYDPGK